jgi:hypothetical protein
MRMVWTKQTKFQQKIHFHINVITLRFDAKDKQFLTVSWIYVFLKLE